MSVATGDRGRRGQMASPKDRRVWPELRRRTRLGALLLLTGALVPAAAGGASLAAQQARMEPGARVLTLREALNLATRNNPQYLRALNRLELLGPRQRQAWASFLPSLNAGYSTGQGVRREVSWVGFDGRPTENPTPSWIGSSNANMSLSMDLDIFDGGRKVHEWRRTQAGVRADRLNARAELDGVLADVHTRFLTLQRQQARLALETDLLADRQQDLDLTQRRFELALDRRTDLLAREFDVEQQRANLRDAQGRVETAMNNLRVAIGDPSLLALEVEEPLPEPFDPASLDLEGLVARALSQNPSVRAQEAQVSSSQASVRIQNSLWWPRVTARSTWGRSAYETGPSALFDMQPGRTPSGNASWGFSFTVPLFDGFQRSYSAASARVDLRNANESLRQARLQLELDVKTMHAELTTAWETLVLRDRALELASDRLEMMRDEYQLANVDIQSLRSAIADEASAQREAVDQRFAFALALLALYRAVGTVGEELGIETVPLPNPS